ncbi:MAG: YceI family protein [Gammaproteobacteria bacterium]|nr:YceI family protein [Gammaproteobacteria bacterium]
MKIEKLLLLLVAAFSAVANANDASSEHLASVANLDLAAVGHVYEIQQHSSSLAFRVDGPFGDVWGSFQEFKGDFAMLGSGSQDKTAAIEINTESLDTSVGFIRAMLKSESFFDVEKFPLIHFAGSSIEWYSETQGVLKGEMTIQKTTLPVAFYVELVDGDGEYSDRITVKASTTIKRSEFGLYTLLPIVSDDVNIFMSVDALRKGAATSIKSASAGNNRSFN